MGAQNERSPLSRGITAVIFGCFGLMWFGWGKEAPPGWLSPWLSVGMVVAVAVGIAGVAVCFRHRTAQAPARDRVERRRYGVVVGIEFAAIGILAAVLGATGHAAFIPVVVAAVVGLHFYPLATVLHDPQLRPLSLVTCVIAVLGLVTGLTSGVAPSAVIGPGVGVALVGYAALGLGPMISR